MNRKQPQPSNGRRKPDPPPPPPLTNQQARSLRQAGGDNGAPGHGKPRDLKPSPSQEPVKRYGVDRAALESDALTPTEVEVVLATDYKAVEDRSPTETQVKELVVAINARNKVDRLEAESQRLRDLLKIALSTDHAMWDGNIVNTVAQMIREYLAMWDILIEDSEHLGGDDNYHYTMATVAKIDAELEDK